MDFILREKKLQEMKGRNALSHHTMDHKNIRSHEVNKTFSHGNETETIRNRLLEGVIDMDYADGNCTSTQLY